MPSHFDIFNQFLRKYVEFTDAELLDFNNKCSCVEFSKGDLVMKAGQVQKNLYFITEGIVRNFIELDKIKNISKIASNRSVMANENEKIITHISNFRKVKRIPDVIDIFYKIQQKIPSKLMMVGDGPEKVTAENLCFKLGISDKVIFFGNSNEIDKILSFTDLFLLPSETESFGLAALEAMAWGVPVISSNTGGLSEVNFDGISGYLSDVGNTGEMSQNAIKILENESTLLEFKNNASTTAKQFDIKNIVTLYENLYKEALVKK